MEAGCWGMGASKLCLRESIALQIIVGLHKATPRKSTNTTAFVLLSDSLCCGSWTNYLYRHQSKMSSSKKFDLKWTLRQVFIRVYRLEIHTVSPVGMNVQFC
jgi:hypothetical protein